MLLQFEEHDRRIFWTLVVLGICALLLYAYFISSAVVAVVARKEAERELGRMTAQVAALESVYASLDKAIDLTLARTQGFVEVATPRYISTVTKENMLTLRDGTTPP